MYIKCLYSIFKAWKDGRVRGWVGEEKYQKQRGKAKCWHAEKKNK